MWIIVHGHSKALIPQHLLDFKANDVAFVDLDDQLFHFVPIRWTQPFKDLTFAAFCVDLQKIVFLDSVFVDQACHGTQMAIHRLVVAVILSYSFC
jgi:hypothetical protein